VQSPAFALPLLLVRIGTPAKAALARLARRASSQLEVGGKTAAKVLRCRAKAVITGGAGGSTCVPRALDRVGEGFVRDLAPLEYGAAHHPKSACFGVRDSLEF
jgi:hypothetical protein